MKSNSKLAFTTGVLGWCGFVNCASCGQLPCCFKTGLPCSAAAAAAADDMAAAAQVSVTSTLNTKAAHHPHYHRHDHDGALWCKFVLELQSMAKRATQNTGTYAQPKRSSYVQFLTRTSSAQSQHKAKRQSVCYPSLTHKMCIYECHV